MGIVVGLFLVVLGILGAASLIIAKKPDAKELIDKLTPYQGWIGFVAMWWGLWTIIHAILSLGTWFKYAKFWWLTYLASGVILLALGILLGVGVFKSFIKDETANEKMDVLVKKLAPYQGTLGFVSIGLGIWAVLGFFILL